MAPGAFVTIFAITSLVFAAGKPVTKVRKPAKPPQAPVIETAVGSGADRYTPTKCEWLAVELNSNFREAVARNGYTSQFFCRPPSTIFISIHYEKDSDQSTATAAADTARDAIGQVMRARDWKWVKIEEEIAKSAPAAAQPEKKAETRPKPAASEEEETPTQGDTVQLMPVAPAAAPAAASGASSAEESSEQ